MKVGKTYQQANKIQLEAGQHFVFQSQLEEPETFCLTPSGKLLFVRIRAKCPFEPDMAIDIIVSHKEVARRDRPREDGRTAALCHNLESLSPRPTRVASISSPLKKKKHFS